MATTSEKLKLRLFPSISLSLGGCCGPSGCGPGSCGPGCDIGAGPSPDEQFLDLLESLLQDFGDSIEVYVAGYATPEDLNWAIQHLGPALKAGGVQFDLTYSNFALVMASLAPVLTVEDKILYYKQAPAYAELRNTIAKVLESV